MHAPCLPDFSTVADASLRDERPSREQALALLRTPDEDFRDLLWQAFRVREARFGRRVKLSVLQNARSGLCPEDCHYCSQSAVLTAYILRLRLMAELSW